MGLWRRIRSIGRAEYTSRRGDEPSDPAERLLGAVREQRAALDEARRAVDEVTVGRRRAELLREREQEEVDVYQEAARIAVAHGNDTAAREAISRGIAARERRDRLDVQADLLAGREAELRESIGRLESHVRQVDAERRALVAQRAAVRASSSMVDVSRSGGAGDTAQALRGAEREVAELSERRRAAEEIAATDPESLLGKEAFESLGREEVVEIELRRLGGGHDT
ncbi:Phage shock protein A [Actinomycetales bacterium JB111]|nr:Phage shock protein A [Actinomycetales bacterium JB111]